MKNSGGILVNSVHVGFANRRILPMFEWLSEVLYAAPGMHRFTMAASAWGAMQAASKVRDVLVGKDSKGEEIRKEDLPKGVQWAHGMLDFNPYSDQWGDLWRKGAARLFVPAVGGVGGALGSYHFFHTQQDLPAKNAALTREQGKGSFSAAVFNSRWEMARPARWFTALGGIPASSLNPEGFTFLTAPVAWSFQTHDGKNTATPWLGKKLTNTHAPKILNPALLLQTISSNTIANYKNLVLDHNGKGKDLFNYKIDELITGGLGPMIKGFSAENAVTVRKAFLEQHKDALEMLASGAPSAHLHRDLTKFFQSEQLIPLLKKEGIIKSITDIDPTDYGFLGKLSNFFGQRKRIDAVRYDFWKEANKHLPEDMRETLPEHVVNFKPPRDLSPKIGMAIGAVAAGALAAGGVWLYKRSKERAREREKEHARQEEETKRLAAEGTLDFDHTGMVDRDTLMQEAPVRTRIKHPLLDKLVKACEGATVPPGWHRLFAAAGLTMGFVSGIKVTGAFTGRDFRGQVVSREQQLGILKPIYDTFSATMSEDAGSFARAIRPKLEKTQFFKNGAFRYDPNNWGKIVQSGGQLALSNRDQWMRGLHRFTIAASGMILTLAGSALYLRHRTHEKSIRKPEYLEDFGARASMEQSSPWGVWTGASALWSSTSGMTMFPFPFPFGWAQGKRYQLAMGRETFWHNEFLLQPEGLLKHMAAYTAHNGGHELPQLPRMTKTLLDHWFDGVTQDQYQAFENAVRITRRKALAQGSKPDDVQKMVYERISKEGLENLIESIGLDLRKAKLGRYGLPSTIATMAGAGQEVRDLKKDYLVKYEARRNARECNKGGLMDGISKAGSQIGHAATELIRRTSPAPLTAIGNN